MATVENEYGLREVTAADKHGEIDVWLEKLIEVVNFKLAVWGREFKLAAIWDGPERITLAAEIKNNGKAVLERLGEETDCPLPKSFIELAEVFSLTLISNFDIDEESWGRESLLEMAQILRKMKRD